MTHTILNSSDVVAYKSWTLYLKNPCSYEKVTITEVVSRQATSNTLSTGSYNLFSSIVANYNDAALFDTSISLDLLSSEFIVCPTMRYTYTLTPENTTFLTTTS